MTETRQGEAERGYSMTLSRIFDPRDRGLLLAVCFGPEGRPLAFNQYVPASQVNGYSLDLMRRTSDESAPNGLTDFVIIETIAWMAARRATRPRAQLRHHAGRGGRRGNGRSVDLARAIGAPPLQRHDADRVALEVQQEVRPVVGPPLRGHRAVPARWPAAAWPSPGPSRSPRSPSWGACSRRGSRRAPPTRAEASDHRASTDRRAPASKAPPYPSNRLDRHVPALTVPCGHPGWRRLLVRRQGRGVFALGSAPSTAASHPPGRAGDPRAGDDRALGCRRGGGRRSGRRAGLGRGRMEPWPT